MTVPTASKPYAGETTNDSLFGGSLSLRQPAAGYRVAVDSVLLAAAVPAVSGEAVLDAGSGVGAAALCLAYRVTGCQVTGVEVQGTLASLAGDNVTANGMTSMIDIVKGDLSALPVGLATEKFDHLMTNPPYLRASESRISPSLAKALATVEQDLDLAAWLSFCMGRLKPRGTITVIHRADRLDEVLTVMTRYCGALVVFPLWSKLGEDARRMIVRGTLGRETPLRLSAGLVLHGVDGGYTREAEAILREGVALDL